MAEIVIGSAYTAAARAWICAQLGWRVIPLVAKTKIPAIKNWPTQASADFDRLDEWFNGQFVGHEVGIVTGSESGIFVLDIDVHWCNGRASARDLWKKHGETRMPNTFRVATPSGGEQWYFKYPRDGKKIRNLASKPSSHGPLGPGLDIRGWHGQVVAPLALGRDIIKDVLVSEPPSWLLEIVTREAAPSKAVQTVNSNGSAMEYLAGMAEKLSKETAGRNDMLNGMSFKLGLLGGRGLLSEEDARAAMHEACVQNGAIGDEPDAWRNGEGQFDATFTSGWNAGVVKGARGD